MFRQRGRYIPAVWQMARRLRVLPTDSLLRSRFSAGDSTQEVFARCDIRTSMRSAAVRADRGRREVAAARQLDRRPAADEGFEPSSPPSMLIPLGGRRWAR